MRLTPLIVALGLLGCGRTAEDICEDIREECSDGIDHEDCVSDAQVVEELADTMGCEAEYDEYLDCLDHDVCEWRSCGAPRERLEACVGPFPNDAF